MTDKLIIELILRETFIFRIPVMLPGDNGLIYPGHVTGPGPPVGLARAGQNSGNPHLRYGRFPLRNPMAQCPCGEGGGIGGLLVWLAHYYQT